jgi:DNA polymerase-3 subunit delta
MIHLILGPDYALARQEMQRLMLASDPDGESTSVLDGSAVSVQDVMMATASLGFFSAGRTIVVEGLLAKHAKGTGKGATADWGTLFASVPAETTLILVDHTVLSVPAAVKKALPADAVVVPCDPPRGRDLVEWIATRARAGGGTIDRNVAQRLAITLYPAGWSQKSRNPAFDRPPDMEGLGHEVDKLVVAAHPGPVTEDHIRALVAAGDNDQIFGFIDAASAGNIERAAPELERLLAAGEDPYKILSQLCGSVELAVAMDRADRRDPAEVGKDLRLPNVGRMNAVARSVRDQPRHFAPRVGRVLEETDRKMKTGELRDPVEALYYALASIASLRLGR